MNEFIPLILLEIEKLQKATLVLEYSFNKCLPLYNKPILNDDELVEVEAYTARFARLADVFLHISLKLIDKVDIENEGTVRDRLNRADKKRIIETLDGQIEIRKLRNKLAHEYITLSTSAFLESANILTPVLIKDVANAIQHLQNYLA